jgi:3-dehydroquinate dehydratase II
VRAVVVLNAPTLGRLGSREPAVYGTGSYADLLEACEQTAAELGLEVDVRQTDDEATLIGWLHEAADAAGGVILNPAAFTHYSYAVRDAVAIVTGAGVPLVEVHLSQPAAREEFRQLSVVAPVATGTISGLGLDSYRCGLRALVPRLRR